MSGQTTMHLYSSQIYHSRNQNAEHEAKPSETYLAFQENAAVFLITTWASFQFFKIRLLHSQTHSMFHCQTRQLFHLIHHSTAIAPLRGPDLKSSRTWKEKKCK
jgi:hypothetical protein